MLFTPASAGIAACDSEILKGGSAEDNAAIARRLMAGEETGGLLDAVCLNSGAGLYVAGRIGSIVEGYRESLAAFASGSVLAKCNAVVTRARELAEER